MKETVRKVIFEADTPMGKLFDVVLILVIVASVVAVSLASLEEVNEVYGLELKVLEWLFTVLFTVEYALRLWCVRVKWRYAVSFFGVIDLVAIIPTYLSLLLPGAEYLIVVRALRALRVFRILKLLEYMRGAYVIREALAASRYKIMVFITAVSVLVVIIGAVMYLVEGVEHGFTSIPRSIYWAIVTLTTVGYGDIAPQTTLGQVIASFVMLTGYAIIAVPTGIVTAELARANELRVRTVMCPECQVTGHGDDARFCRKCGAPLNS